MILGKKSENVNTCISNKAKESLTIGHTWGQNIPGNT